MTEEEVLSGERAIQNYYNSSREQTEKKMLGV